MKFEPLRERSILIQSLYEPQLRAPAKGAPLVGRLDELHAERGDHARAELLLLRMHLFVFLYLTLQFLVLELELLQLLRDLFDVDLDGLLLVLELGLEVPLHLVLHVFDLVLVLLLEVADLLEERIGLQLGVLRLLMRKLEVFLQDGYALTVRCAEGPLAVLPVTLLTQLVENVGVVLDLRRQLRLKELVLLAELGELPVDDAFLLRHRL